MQSLINAVKGYREYVMSRVRYLLNEEQEQKNSDNNSSTESSQEKQQEEVRPKGEIKI